MPAQPKVDFKAMAAAAKTESVDGEKVLGLCQRMEIENDAELRFAVSAIAEIKDKAATVAAKRDSYITPAQEIIDAAKADWNPCLNSLAAAEKVLKEQIIYYDATLTEKRTELLTAVKKTRSQTKRAALITQAETFVIGKVPGMSFKRHANIEISDEAKAVAWCIKNRRDLLTINTKALKEAMKNEDVPPKVAGVDVGEATSVSVTAARVERV